MKRYFNISTGIVLLIIAYFMISCKNIRGTDSNSHRWMGKPIIREHTAERGVYHWKTILDLNQEEIDFLQEHDVSKVYVRMFDVGAEWDDYTNSYTVIPIATTQFKSKISQSVEVIPTVYITLEALRESRNSINLLAQHIVERVINMCSWNNLGEIKEIQYDCDWTESTREQFFFLCEMSRKVFAEKGLDIKLSGTIRLHQVEEAEYPFDTGVLMMYNTGAVKNSLTKNSILNYDDVYKYLSVNSRIDKFLKAREYNCPVIDVAYPAYSWGVVFYNDHFRKLVRNPELYVLEEGENIRFENSEIETILKVKQLVDSKIGKVVRGNIIYHLDSKNLSKYTNEEIEHIYN